MQAGKSDRAWIQEISHFGSRGNTTGPGGGMPPQLTDVDQVPSDSPRYELWLCREGLWALAFCERLRNDLLNQKNESRQTMLVRVIIMIMNDSFESRPLASRRYNPFTGRLVDSRGG